MDGQQTILVDVCCAWWEYAITTCHVNIWIYVNLAKSLLSYTQHQQCEPTSLCWGVKVFVSPTGIAKCLMKHPRGSCRWTMEWDPEGWMRLLLGKLIESWKKLQFTIYIIFCLFVCLYSLYVFFSVFHLILMSQKGIRVWWGLGPKSCQGERPTGAAWWEARAKTWSMGVKQLLSACFKKVGFSCKGEKTWEKQYFRTCLAAVDVFNSDFLGHWLILANKHRHSKTRSLKSSGEGQH